MKKLTVLSLVTVLVITLGTSCSKDVKYSCDPEVDAWAKENIEDIRTMTRTQFLDLSVAYQQAAYSVFSADKKIDVWSAKCAELLELPWTDLEKDHINALLTLIKENDSWWYQQERANSKRELEAIADEVMIKTYRWTEYAYETLGWDKDLVRAIIASPGQLMDTKGKLRTGKNELSGSILIKTRGESTCDCSRSSDWCSGYNQCGKGCIRGNTPYDWVCGTFLMYRCDGVCG